MRVAVDIGGTFTDAVAVVDDGQIRTAKVPTTPGRLHDGVLAALDDLQIDWGRLEGITHGTTAGLNAFLEGRGAKVALLTTLGFRDVYEIGRANRPDMYNVRYRPPKPLVPRRWVFEINERLAADGSVLTPLEVGDIRSLAGRLGEEFDSVAVCFLHSYANPAHEQRVAEILAECCPGLSVTLSHVVAPEWREYERTSTTVISAYIAPIVEQYLSELSARVAERGLRGPLHVMQSNGGVMSAEMARGKPIQTLFSGPVGGAIAGVAVADDLHGEADVERLICVDMGGTSFDMSLVVNGRAEIELESELKGHPVLAPAVAIHTIGAGGGSVGYSSAGGLRVGPRSAGAVPGPACYGTGGDEPTITDANLLLGRLPSFARLADDMRLDKAAAASALAQVGATLGLESEELAAGMIAVADAAMANAIREITVLQGIDPRQFALVAFGGAGPLHAVSLAEELSVDSVIVPADPGVLSAYGMLHSDARHDIVRSFYVRVDDLSPDLLISELGEMEGQARAILADDGADTGKARIEPSADLRYAGQEYTVTLPLDLSGGAAAQIRGIPGQFAQAHEVRYGHSNPGEAVEFVNLRMTGYGAGRRPVRKALPTGGVPEPEAIEKVSFAGDWVNTPIYLRAKLPGGVSIEGPIVVLEGACTTLVPPGWKVFVSRQGHLLLKRTGDE